MQTDPNSFSSIRLGEFTNDGIDGQMHAACHPIAF